MTPEGRPTVIMVVQNDVSGDTRVKKMALTLAHAGCAVTVYGFSKEAHRWETVLGSVRIVRLADPPRATGPTLVGRAVRRAAAYDSRAALQQAVARREARRAQVVAAVTAWKARIDARQHHIHGQERSFLDRLVVASLWYRIKGLRAAAKIPESAFRLRLSITRRDRVFRKLLVKARRRINRVGSGAPRPLSSPLSHLVRLEQLLLQELHGQDVDVIHAHDFFTIGMAHRAAQMLSGHGASVRWVYDAHEYVRGLDFFTPERRAAALQLEGEHILSADRVITVTPDLADRLREDYRLSCCPDVVMNAPALLEGVTPRATVRSRLHLANDVPLLVYAGQVKEPRDIHTLVAALQFLPHVHLAVLTANEGFYVDGLLDIAARCSASDRYHVLPYVPSHEVSTFLSDATVGVVPLSHYGNAEVALPTKLFEFLHARLPMVVSDTRAMRRFVKELGVGEIFVAGNARSLAAAVETVLEQLDTYREALLAQPDALVRYSWQRQERILLEAYSNVLEKPLVRDGQTPTSLEEHPCAPRAQDGRSGA